MSRRNVELSSENISQPKTFVLPVQNMDGNRNGRAGFAFLAIPLDAKADKPGEAGEADQGSLQEALGFGESIPGLLRDGTSAIAAP